MHISRLFCSLLLSAACLVPAQAQLFTSSDSKRTAPGQNRTLRYQPDGEDFVIVNGNRKFTRALYGSNTGFRLETSDVPEFALYMPRMGGNLSLGVIVGGKSLWLNDARHIESRYSAGSRIYTITDSLLGKGSIVVTALAMYEADGMILKIEGNKLPSDTRLVWLYGGPTNKRFSREGDMGVDAPDCFDLKPDYCVDNIYRLDDDGFDVWYGTSRENIQRYLAGKNPETGKNPVCQLTAVVPDASSLLLGDAMARTTPISLRETAPSDKYPVVSGTVSLRKKPSYIAIYNPKTAPAAWRYDDLAACFDRADKSRARGRLDGEACYARSLFQYARAGIEYGSRRYLGFLRQGVDARSHWLAYAFERLACRLYGRCHRSPRPGKGTLRRLCRFSDYRDRTCHSASGTRQFAQFGSGFEEMGNANVQQRLYYP